MNNSENSRRLKESLRQAYRSTSASPYLSQRILSNVKSNKWTLMPELKLAGGIFSIFALVFLLTSYNNNESTIQPVTELSNAVLLQYPSVIVPDYSSLNIELPQLSSLAEVPTLNRFQSPAISLEIPGDYCIYQRTGEMSC